jgi:hypothetical protein
VVEALRAEGLACAVLCGTYVDGSVEEIEADELRDAGTTPFLTFVNYRVLFVTTIYVEIVRRLDRRAIRAIDQAISTA